MKKHIKNLIFFLILFNYSLSVYANGISLSSTRVIFNASKENAVITVLNNTTSPWLIRARSQIDPNSSIAAPFAITPPLFRIEPEDKNTVRIFNVDSNNLPIDRESVFYLSFLAIPTSDKLVESTDPIVSAKVTIGINTVIKLFYRPENLENKTTSINDLDFNYKNQVIEVKNLTPYYQTLSKLKLDMYDIPIQNVGAMIEPFSTKKFIVPNKLNSPKKIYWSIIDDLGLISEQYEIIIN